MNKILHSSKGAVDLASIMVGITIIGLVGGIISATVFAVIPWAQDHAAREQLKAISQAQSVHAGFSMEDPNISGSITTIKAAPTALPSNLRYGNLQNLYESGLFEPEVGIASNGIYSTDLKMCSQSVSNGQNFSSAVVSGSGKTFYVPRANHRPLLATPGTITCLGRILDSGVPEYSVTTPPVTPSPGPTTPPVTTPTPTPPPVTPTPIPTPTAPPVVNPYEEWIIPDENLRWQIETILGVTGILYLSDADEITNLNASGLDFSEVRTAQGLEKATGLTTLNNVVGGNLTDTLGFGNIVEIEKGLIIENSQMTVFDGFEKLRTVGEHIRFQNNSRMASVPMFATVTEAGGINVSNMQVVNNLNFGNLTTLGEYGITINNNPTLSDYSGFNGPLSTDGIITVSGNTSLRSLSAFSNLRYAKGVEVSGNRTLMSVNFNNLTKVGSSGLKITNNISFDSIDGFGDLTTIEGDLRIENNQNIKSVLFNSLSSTKNFFVTNNGNQLSVSGMSPTGSYGSVNITINGKTYNSVSSYLSR